MCTRPFACLLVPIDVYSLRAFFLFAVFFVLIAFAQLDNRKASSSGNQLRDGLKICGSFVYTFDLCDVHAYCAHYAGDCLYFTSLFWCEMSKWPFNVAAAANAWLNDQIYDRHARIFHIQQLTWRAFRKIFRQQPNCVITISHAVSHKIMCM